MHNRPHESSPATGKGLPTRTPLVPSETGRSGSIAGSVTGDIYDWLIHELHAESTSGTSGIAPAQDVSRDSTGLMGQLRDLVSREVAWVQELGADSLTVMLYLGSDIELDLRLAHREGGLQACLRCERGDPSVLRANWEFLRNALSERHVQLQPLEESLWRAGQSSRSAKNIAELG